MDPILLLTGHVQVYAQTLWITQIMDVTYLRGMAVLFSVWCWIVLIIQASAFIQCVVMSSFSSTLMLPCVLSNIYVPRKPHRYPVFGGKSMEGIDHSHPKFEKF